MSNIVERLRVTDPYVFDSTARLMAEAANEIELLRALLVRQDVAEPLTHDKLFNLLLAIDPEAKRLPLGFRQFALAVETEHGIVAHTP